MANDSAKVSVVIPLFNKEKEIARAIRSVLNQQERPAEIIVVDDGSTDSGPRIVADMKEPLVRMERQPNAGVSAARNRGVARAASNLVAFLDADDEWKPSFLRNVLELHGRFPCAGLWATGFEFVDVPGGPARVHICPGVPATADGGLLPDFFLSSLQGAPFCASSVLHSRGLLDEIGGFPAGVGLGEDLDVWIRIALRYPVAFSPVSGAVYHRDAQNRAMTLHRWSLADSCVRRTLGAAIAERRSQGTDSLSLRKLLGWHLFEIARREVAVGNKRAARRALLETLGYRVWIWRASRYLVRSCFRSGRL